MNVGLVNHQRRDAVPLARLTALAQRAVQRLRLNGRGRLTFNFIDSPTMQALNRRFIGHHRLTPPLSSGKGRTWRSVNEFLRVESQFRRLHGKKKGAGLTDVLSFRYPLPAPRSGRLRVARQAGRESVVGEVLIAPAAARRYANAHRVSYEDELARYIVHGLLHWMGHDDRTLAQQRKMRTLEDRLLRACGGVR